MIDLLPQARERGLTWDLYDDEAAPIAGEYLVSIGKGRKANSVYVIVSLRKTNGKVHRNRYALRVVKANDLLPVTKVNWDFEATVNGEPAYGFVWNPRNKSK